VVLTIHLGDFFSLWFDRGDANLGWFVGCTGLKKIHGIAAIEVVHRSTDTLY
jgi:hypothetical protein